MDTADRKELSDRWLKNEAELHRLGDVPVGQSDPAQREAEIDHEQDEIEYELGRDYLYNQRGEPMGKYHHNMIDFVGTLVGGPKKATDFIEGCRQIAPTWNPDLPQMIADGLITHKSRHDPASKLDVIDEVALGPEGRRLLQRGGK